MKITINQLETKLNKLANLNYKKELERAAILVENEAKKKAPVGTGELRRSITHSIDDLTASVGTNLEYAPYVEFGTGLFAAEGNGRQDVPWHYQDAEGNWHTTYGQEPQPYLYPALEENKEQIKEIFMNGIKEALK